MRVMVFAKGSEMSEGGMAPTPEVLEAFAAMDAFTEELVKAGVFVAAAGLKPSADGKRVVTDGGRRTIIAGRSPKRASSSPASRFGRFATWTRRSPGRSAVR